MTNIARSLPKEDFRRWNEDMAKTYDPDTYHRSSNGFIAWVERCRVRALLRLLAVRPEHRVLEVGVGAGNILEQIHTARRTGIDLSQFLLDKAHQRLGDSVTLIEGDVEELDRHFPACSFERVFCSEVLEHVQHPDTVLAQMARVVTADGIVVVSVPNEEFINRIKSLLSVTGILGRLFPRVPERMEDAWHLHAFSRSLLTSLAGRRFLIERIEAVPSRFLPIRFVARLRPRPILAALPSLLCCPSCRSPLERRADAYRCLSCSKTFADHQGRPMLIVSANGLDEKESGTEHRLKTFFKHWPSIYRICAVIIGPALLTGLTAEKFAERYAADSRILHVGSGVRRPGHNSVNMDILPLDGVDVVGDVMALPFADGAFDAVSCEEVLEHVPQPLRAARDLRRVTKPGGLIHIAVPFVYPWHPSPLDYTRWTLEGLEQLLPDCTVVERGIIAGPCSAFIACTSVFLATMFSLGIQPLKVSFQYLLLILLAPLKLLDLIAVRIRGAEHCSAAVYVVLRVPLSPS